MQCVECRKIIPGDVLFCAYCGAIQGPWEPTLDPAIKQLVLELRAHGVQTVMSCEGHQEHGFPYPWVDVVLEDEVRLLHLVRRFNIRVNSKEIQPEVTWVIEPQGDLRIYPSNRGQPLATLQKSAEAFGEFLQRSKEKESCLK